MAKKRSSKKSRKKTISTRSVASKQKFEEFDPKKIAAQFASSNQMQELAISPIDGLGGISVSKDLFKAKKELKTFVQGMKVTSQHSVMVSQLSSSMTSGGAENIRGVSVGLRKTKYGYSSEVAAKVFVAHKLPEKQLDKASIIPKDISGIPTDVEECSELVQQAPIKLGSTCAPEQPIQPGGGVFIGTMGCLVVLNNGRLGMLSNNHVLALNNSVPLGTGVFHPNHVSPGNTQIGVLENFVPLRFGSTSQHPSNPINRVDAAVAWTSTQFVSPDHHTFTINPTPVVPQLNMPVTKHGQTTGNTTGMITDISFDTAVGVTINGMDRAIWYDDQIKVVGVSGRFSAGGDSGSLIVTAGSKQPVALLHAGAIDGSFTTGSPIQQVMSEVGIDRFFAG